MTDTFQRMKPIETPAGSWSDAQPVLMRFAASYNRFAPRGKGVIPRWIGRNFGGGWRTTIRTDSGCRLAVDPANLDLFVTIQNEGAWEPWIRRALILSVRDSDVFYDVGANAGTLSNEVGRAHPNAIIRAFEPQLELARLVAVSARLNGLQNVEVFPVAVGDHSGTIQLHKPAHALHASTIGSGEAKEQIVDCPLVTLDEAVQIHGLQVPNVIKVDVEGGELAVLQGAKWIISNHSPILVFESNESCHRFGYTRNDLFRLIRSLGEYSFFQVAPGDVLAAPASRVRQFADVYPCCES